jgi:hypothetical protein
MRFSTGKDELPDEQPEEAGHVDLVGGAQPPQPKPVHNGQMSGAALLSVSAISQGG